MNPKSIVYVISFISFGFVSGMAVQHYILGKTIKESIKSVQMREWIEAKNYLAISSAIRSNNTENALHFSEEMVELNVNGFTNKGQRDNLNRYEQSTLDMIRTYRLEQCSNNCLNDIKGILEK